jgi:hypothetical protein
MSICFPVAFVVLAFATRNLLVALYAIISIGGIVVSVLGFCKAQMDWGLGIGESVAGIIVSNMHTRQPCKPRGRTRTHKCTLISYAHAHARTHTHAQILQLTVYLQVIGFSVDYVVHLGHMLLEAAELGLKTRRERFEYAASKMGSTVMAGAITTGGSSLFMLVCQMTFFLKMAILISITIFLSFVFSLGFFMSLILQFGPENDQGMFRIPGCDKKPARETEATPAPAGEVVEAADAEGSTV